MPMRKTYKSCIINNTTASYIELWSQKFYILIKHPHPDSSYLVFADQTMIMPAFQNIRIQSIILKCHILWSNLKYTATFIRLVQSCAVTVVSHSDPHGQARLSMEFSRHYYWIGLPFPFLRYLPGPGVKPATPSLAGGFFTTVPPGKPKVREC